MALIKADRVKETSTSTGTGNFTLAGAATGFRRFSSVCTVGNYDYFFYVIDSDSGNEWEVGYGYYSATNTLTRTQVHASSNSGSLVNFSAGTKNVYISITEAQSNWIYLYPKANVGQIGGGSSQFPQRAVEITSAAHTGLANYAEFTDFLVDFGSYYSPNFLGGLSRSLQRAARFVGPKYTCSTAGGTITNAVTMEISTGPIAGTNLTITKSIVLRVTTGTETTHVGLVVQGASGQTGNLQEWQDSSGTVLSAVKSNGAIQPATLTDAAAPNNSIYYSSTQSKLVYKNSAGTVNLLY